MIREKNTVYSEKKLNFAINAELVHTRTSSHFLCQTQPSMKGTIMATTRKHYGFLHLLLDFFLVLITGGLWFIWIVIRFLRSNS